MQYHTLTSDDSGDSVDFPFSTNQDRNERCPFFESFQRDASLGLSIGEIIGIFDLDFLPSELAIPVIQGLDTRVPLGRRMYTGSYV